MSFPRLFLVGMLMEMLYLSFYICADGPNEVLLLIAVNAVAYLLLSLVVRAIRKAPSGPEDQTRSLILIVAFGLLFRLSLVPHTVVGSDDIYRYLWDGKVASSGINPFAHLPRDPELSRLASTDLPSKVNHPELRTVYPALAQAFFYSAYRLFGESAAGVKLLLVAMDGLTIALLWGFLRRRASPASGILLYAWSPLPVLYFGLDGHIDALGIPFLILSLIYFTTSRPVRGAVALGFSALAKLVPLIAVPLLLRNGRGLRHTLLLAIPPAMVAGGYLLFYEPTWGVVDSLKTFGTHWEFNGSVFSVIYFLSGSNNQTAHQMTALLMVLCLGIITLLRRPIVEKTFWGFVFFILLSPVVHPWYLTWLAALLVLRWSTAIFAFLGLSLIANVVVYQYRAYGEWVDQPLLLLCEYLPVAVLLAGEFIRREVLPREPLTSTGQQKEGV